MYPFLRNTILKTPVSAFRFAWILWAMIAPVSVFAQGWQRYYGGERLFSIDVLPDGSLVAAGSFRATGGASDGYWLHADAWGNPLTDLQFGTIASGENAQVLLPATGGIWALPGNSTGDSIFWAAVNIQGTLPGNPHYLTNGLLYSAAVNQQGEWFFCGTKKDTNVLGNNTTLTLSGMVNATGQLVWERTDSIGLNSVGVDIAVTASGDYWIIGRLVSTFSTVNSDAFLLKINSNGDVLQTRIFTLTDEETPEKTAVVPNGHLLITGSVKNPANTSLQEEDIWLAETDDSGNLLWTKAIPLPGFQQAHALTVLPNGDLILAGETRPNLTGSRDAFLARTDAAGNLLWFKTYGGIKGDIFWDVAVLPDGGFALAGQTASYGDGALHAWLVRTDSNGNVWSNHLEGQVAHDQTQDCLIAAGEPPLANWLVAAAGAPGIFYTKTDSNGYYNIALDTGLWYISVLPPVDYWLPCFDSVAVTMVQMGDTANISFPVQAAFDCALLQVDITTPYLRRCFENEYTVRWFNYGPAAADATIIAVLPDAYLTITSSSLPFTTSGDTLWFETGITASLQGGSLTFTALLDCDDTVLGQTHCTTAWIAPDSFCYNINPEWDGASLDVNGYCAGDSVILTITNTGMGNMQQAVEYVITEDQVIFKRAPLLLAAGADTTIILYPNGATITLMLPQTPGHPGNSHPTLVIEGCGAQPFSTGYALPFPSDDGDPFIDTECRENIGSFDPNDKTGLPNGVGPTHIIKTGDAIDYLIRFQNTGTDTAFRVEIRDTLPATLDIVSLELGAASHPYLLEIRGKGVLRFIFDPVALLDSAAGYDASQGFVKYRIRTKTGLADGTAIRNSAAIYFDFNTPVFTGTTLHTIGEPLDVFTTIVAAEPDIKTGVLSVCPNPFYENTLLTWPLSNENNTCNIQITDVDGRIRARYATTENTFMLSNTNLPPGMYFLKIYTDTKEIASGKIIKTK